MAPKHIDEWTPNLWAFRTARYTVMLFAEPEEIDPSDTFEFEDEDDPAHWFCAIVAVYDEYGARIGYDTLGGCSYRSFAEFYQSHRNRDPMERNCSLMRAARGRNVVICEYFPNMVRQAIADARTTLGLHRDGDVRAA